MSQLGYRPDDSYYRAYGNPSPYGREPAPRPAQFFNLGQPSGPLEGLAQSVLPMFAEMLRNQYGGAAFTFGSDRNQLSARYAQQFLQQTNEARAEGARADQGQITELLTGVARMIGHNVNDPGVKKDVGRLSGDLSAMMPFLAAMFPDQVDAWLPRGSMAVASARFVSAGRFVTDPATGLPVSTDKEYGARIMKDLMDAGPGATSGLRAGQVGGIYEQLVSRGLVGDTQQGRDRVKEAEQVDNLFGTNFKEATGGRERKAQAQRVQSQLAQYSEAVAAMNDIFLDADKKGTVPQLFDALEKLTAGGVGVMDPNALAKSARMGQAVAQMTGMSLEAQSAATGQFAQALGAKAPGVAAYLNQYSAMLGRTFIDAGLTGAGPEAMRIGDLKAGADNLLAAGYVSDSTRVAATVLSLDTDLGAGGKGTPLRAVADAIREGKKAAVLPDGTNVDLTKGFDTNFLTRTAAQSGLGPNAFLERLQAQGLIDAEARTNGPALRQYNQNQQTRELQNEFSNGVFATPDLRGFDGAALYTKVQERLAQGFDGRPVSTQNLVDLTLEDNPDLQMSPAQRSALVSRIDRFGGLRRLTAGNEVLRDRNADAMRLVEAHADAMGRAASEGRGGFWGNLGRFVTGYDPAKDLLPQALGIAGLVPNANVINPLAAAAAGEKDVQENLAGIYGMDFKGVTEELKKLPGEGFNWVPDPSDRNKERMMRDGLTPAGTKALADLAERRRASALADPGAGARRAREQQEALDQLKADSDVWKREHGFEDAPEEPSTGEPAGASWLTPGAWGAKVNRRGGWGAPGAAAPHAEIAPAPREAGGGVGMKAGDRPAAVAITITGARMTERDGVISISGSGAIRTGDAT